MEFWGLEVKPGQSVKVSPEDDFFLHLSQGALGEVKKDDKAIMFVKVDDQKLSIGTLSSDKFPQIQFDLVFEKDFELSHTSKSSSVFFSGYKVFQPTEGDDFDDEDESEDEEEEEKIVPATKANGKAEAKAKEPKQVKIAGAAAAPKPKADAKAVAGKSKKDDDSSDDDESDDDDDDSDSDSDGKLIPINDSDDSMDDDSSDSDVESDDEDEETPKKPESGKKRAAETVLKTPASSDKKKAKIATSSGQKTGDKKGASVHVATPHPGKKTAGKTPATNEKSPKSGGSVACKSCPKTFNSEFSLQAHTNAKHKAAA